MGCRPVSPDRLNSYALVTYLAEPLGNYLNTLREDLVPSCHLRAHLTLLPPRPLACCNRAWERIRDVLSVRQPILIGLGEIEVFEETSVIYLSIREGRDQMTELHALMAEGPLAWEEPYQYQPHITLAQGLSGENVAGAEAVARRRWSDFRYERKFLLDAMTFVQNTPGNSWVDLGQCAMGAVPSLRQVDSHTGYSNIFN